MLTPKYGLSTCQHFGIDHTSGTKILQGLLIFVCCKSSADISISSITLCLIHFVSLWYRCLPILVLYKNFGINNTYNTCFCCCPQFENPKYQYISNTGSPSLILILPKNSIGDRAVHLIRILAIEIVGTTTIQFKAKADALTFNCCF